MHFSFVTPFKERRLLVKLKRKNMCDREVHFKPQGYFFLPVVPVFKMPHTRVEVYKPEKVCINTFVKRTLAGLQYYILKNYVLIQL